MRSFDRGFVLRGWTDGGMLCVWREIRDVVRVSLFRHFSGSFWHGFELREKDLRRWTGVSCIIRPHTVVHG